MKACACGRQIRAWMATCGQAKCRRDHTNKLWREAWRDRRDQWIALGRCHACGGKPLPDRALCSDCTVERDRKKRRAKAAALRSAATHFANERRKARAAAQAARLRAGLPPMLNPKPLPPQLEE